MRPFGGRLLQLGRQSLFFTPDQYADLARTAGLAAIPPQVPFDDVALFRTLGFESVESLDASPAETPTHVADLNQPLPAEWNDGYDVVFDGGTIEHVFDVAQALKSVAALVKPGGRAVHIAVSSNYIDHGFYMFSPTLLSDFYLTNGFVIEEFFLIELCVVGAMEFVYPWTLYSYKPGDLDIYNSGAFGFSHLPMAIWCVARKERTVTPAVVPLQSMYARARPYAAPSTVSPSPVRSLRRWAYTHVPAVVRWKRWLQAPPRPPKLGSIDYRGRFRGSYFE